MKKIFVLIAVFVFAACLCFVYFANASDKQEEYCYEINKLICNETFDTAKVQDSKIVLYSFDGVRLKEIPLEAFDKSVKIAYVRKEGTITYFVLGGAVDDEMGIMFINDESNQLLDGVKSITRIGGNSYRYDTAG